MANISTIKSELSVNARLVVSGTAHDIQWNWGDGSSITNSGTSLSTSHTYANEGTYNVICFYTDGYMDEHGASTSVSVSKSGNPSDRTFSNLNVFEKKPIVIPAECTGDITLYADIKDLDTPDSTDKNQYTSSISAYISMTGFDVNASASTSVEFTYNTASISGVTISDKNLTNLQYVPAFYKYGNATVQYEFYETDDEDSNFNVTWNFEMMIDYTTVPWYNTS